MPEYKIRSFMDFQDPIVNLLLKPEFMKKVTRKLAEMSLDAVEMLLNRGVEIINPFDWEENPNLPELVRRFGKHFIFCGGCIGDLYQHTREDVEFAIRRACSLSEVAGRGYILSISGITEDLSVEDWNTWQAIVN